MAIEYNGKRHIQTGVRRNNIRANRVITKCGKRIDYRKVSDASALSDAPKCESCYDEERDAGDEQGGGE